eukprot:TRINITY_DN776_c3_g1_i1.p1 TRINITY_DN776_c3_g1~~TRINITY_DN776_c3_g1_i1.p1  ORF type:complete len:753 (+),score=127.18 TRINITY_DN776_c3_g1_i1:1274-3532(+)
MKDWKAHVSGKKHMKMGEEGGKTVEEIRTHDAMVVKTIPERHPVVKKLDKKTEETKPKELEVHEVNGAAAVKCTVCAKLIAMKDWLQHIAGKKHLSTGMDERRRIKLDERMTKSLPEIFSLRKTTRTETPRDTIREAVIDKTPTLKTKGVTGVITSTDTVACDYVMHTANREAICGDIPTSSKGHSVGTLVVFDIRIDHVTRELVAHNICHRNTKAEWIPCEELVKIPKPPLRNTGYIELSSAAVVDGLTLMFNIRLQKATDGSVEYIRGGVVRYLRSGFFFDYKSYHLRSRCGAFCFPFSVTNSSQLYRLGILCSFIRSLGHLDFPTEAHQKKEFTAHFSNTDMLLSEVQCPEVLQEVQGVWDHNSYIKKMWRICNDKMEAAFNDTHSRFSQNEGEYLDVGYGFHGTAEQNIQSIATDGFDTSKRRGQAYGPGEYFALNSSTSVGYTKGGSYMFYCKLLIGKPEVHSRYVNHSRFHVVNTQSGTVMALPMYLIRFEEISNATPVWLKSLEDHITPDNLKVNYLPSAIRPVDSSKATLIPLDKMVGEFTVRGVVTACAEKVCKIVREAVNVASIVQSKDILGHVELDVVLATKVAGGKALGELRNKIYDAVCLAVVISSRDALQDKQPKTDKLWKEMLRSGTYFELLIRYPTKKTVKKFCCPNRFSRYVAIRSKYSSSALQEKQLFLNTPLSPAELGGFLNGNQYPRDLTFSIEPESVYSCDGDMRSILCSVITIEDTALAHCDTVLPLYGL